ncbi:hypothetical protein [Oribacterium sp. WCC10]|uniref:hypothetical protein n=1 Tax=Oribacterium sp. WCC10 TaxID=1855343 RepID=UPI0008EFCC90|nr:hypothetical protein [Oribacterium sp. WCC10]SFG67085.1 hypothetical protein SAMN05216356_11824 [Oribacterium sp. WCC10]
MAVALRLFIRPSSGNYVFRVNGGCKYFKLMALIEIKNREKEKYDNEKADQHS